MSTKFECMQPQIAEGMHACARVSTCRATRDRREKQATLSRRRVVLGLPAVLLGVGGGIGSTRVVDAAEWTYDDVGEWPSLCKEGKQQSPVALRVPSGRERQQSSSAGRKVAVTGRAVEVQVQVRSDGCPQLNVVEPGALWVEVDGVKHELRQIHWHAPAEHRVGGRIADLETHFVCSPPLVIGVMLNASTHKHGDDRVLGLALDAINHETTNDRKLFVSPDDVVGLTPHDSLLAYTGSLTTPPCSEGVMWLVDTIPRTVGVEQLASFKARRHSASNARPLQPLGTRRVTALEIQS